MVSKGWLFSESCSFMEQLQELDEFNKGFFFGGGEEVVCLFFKENRLYEKNIRRRIQSDRSRPCFLVLIFPQLDYSGKTLICIPPLLFFPFDILTLKQISESNDFLIF